MKRIQILGVPTLLICIFWAAQASPIRNLPQTLVQPDGSVVHCFTSGDEFNHWLHDKDNYTIVQDPATGYFVYALLENGKLTPSRYVFGKVDPSSVGLSRGVRISPEEMTRRKNQAMNGISGVHVKAPTSGILNNIAIFIRFANESKSVFSDSIVWFDRMFNSSVAGANSMYNYYTEASYGQISILTTFYPSAHGDSVLSYQDTHVRNYYKKYSVTNPIGYETDSAYNFREQTLLKNAVDAVSSQIPQQLNIDANGDGYVDNICFIVSGNVEAWADLLWPHMSWLWSQTAVINGKTVGAYNFQLHDYLQTYAVGVLCHEMFHSLGAPDLYHYSSDGLEPVSSWDIMESDPNPPPHMCAYMKYKYGGWINSIPTAPAMGTYTLSPLLSAANNGYKIPSPYSTAEYFVVEYRRRRGTFESSLPGEGLLVYRINTNYTGNAGGPPDEVYVYRPGGTKTTNGNPAQAPYSSNSGRVLLTDVTSPSSFLTDGSPGGMTLTNVGFLGDSINFTLSRMKIILSTSSIDFGNVAINTNYTAPIRIDNISSSDLRLYSVNNKSVPYTLLDAPSFPAFIAPGNMLELNVSFHPTISGVAIDTIFIWSDDTLNSLIKIALSGSGISTIAPAQAGVMYATTDTQPGGELYRINPLTGDALPGGPMGVPEIRSLTIRPSTRDLYGITTTSASTSLYRIGTDSGTAVHAGTIKLGNIGAIAFSSGDTLFAGTTSGQLYRVNLATGVATFVGGVLSGLSYNGLSFSPTSGKLWACISDRRTVYKVNPTNGVVSYVGSTGLPGLNLSLSFNHSGILYALIGNVSTGVQYLAILDTVNASGTLLNPNPLGVGNLLSIAMRTDSAGNSLIEKRFEISNGWNMLSIPTNLRFCPKDLLFPTSISAAYAYEGIYVARDTLERGKGYWLRFKSAQTSFIFGEPRTADTLNLDRDWNIIGSLSEPVAVSAITSDPPGLVTSRFYGYNGRFFDTDTILPGKAYWVKLQEAGDLILSSSSKYLSAAKILIIPTSEQPPPPPDEASSPMMAIPREYSLGQAYPSPFNPRTTILYQLPVDSKVSLKIYNLLGQVVAVLSDETQQAGFRSATWTATAVASGIYFYRLEAVSLTEPGRIFTQVKKAVLVK